MDHKSILSIHVIYEYVYDVGFFGRISIVLHFKGILYNLITPVFSHYLFQMEHEPAKFVFQSIPANIEMNANVKSLQSDFFNSIVFNIILRIQKIKQNLKF